MKEKIIDRLVSIKSFVTLAVVGTFCYLSVKGEISSEMFMTVVTMIITFYFAKKSE